MLTEDSGTSTVFYCDDGVEMNMALDRVMAGDEVTTRCINGKGAMVNALSTMWHFMIGRKMRRVDPKYAMIRSAYQPRGIFAEDYYADFRDNYYNGRIALMDILRKLSVSIHVYGYLTGRLWEYYGDKDNHFRIELPTGLKESEKLATPIAIAEVNRGKFSKKFVDRPELEVILEEDLFGNGEYLAHEIIRQSIDIYEFCSTYAMSRGVIIAEAKFNFGIKDMGGDHRLELCGDVLTPDTARFWMKDQYSGEGPQSHYDAKYIEQFLSAHLEYIDPDLPLPIAVKDRYLKVCKKLL